MSERFLSGGVIMWPLLILALGIGWLVLRLAVCLRSTSPPLEDVRKQLHAILFWGGMALFLGALGMVVGLVDMAQAIQLAGPQDAPLVWGGVGLSLVSLVFGIMIFLCAGGAWLILDQWSSRVVEREESWRG